MNRLLLVPVLALSLVACSKEGEVSSSSDTSSTKTEYTTPQVAVTDSSPTVDVSTPPAQEQTVEQEQKPVYVTYNAHCYSGGHEIFSGVIKVVEGSDVELPEGVYIYGEHTCVYEKQ